jgi:glycosyltransferase involved in cell wall biosynthesis
MYENKIANSPNILMIHCGGEGGIRGSERCFIDSVKALSYWGYTIRVLRNRDVLDYEIAMYVTEIIDFQFPEIMIDKLSWKLPLLRYATRLRKLIAIINEQQPQVIYVNGGLPCQLAVPAGRICGVPVLCHFHHPAYKRLLYFWLVRYTNMCIFPSQATRDHCLHCAGIDGAVVYNGVDTSVFQAQAGSKNKSLRRELNIPQDAVVIGQVGGLVPHKRPEMLIRLFQSLHQKVPNSYLVLIGSGPLESDLRELVDELGLEGIVILTGYVESTVPYYREVIDINVLASTEEGLGISVLEGSACEIPAVISNVRGLNETVVDHQTGFLFHKGSRKDLEIKLLHLLYDRGLRQEMGLRGRQLVEEMFSLETYMQGVFCVINALHN